MIWGRAGVRGHGVHACVCVGSFVFVGWHGGRMVGAGAGAVR